MTIGWSRVNEHIIEFYLYCIRYTINILYYLAHLQQVRLKSEFLKNGNFGVSFNLFQAKDWFFSTQSSLVQSRGIPRHVGIQSVFVIRMKSVPVNRF